MSAVGDTPPVKTGPAIIKGVLYGALIVIVMLGYGTLEQTQQDKVWDTLLLVFASVGISAALFIGANVLFNASTSNWTLYRTALGAVLGFGLFGALLGNRSLDGIGDGQGLLHFLGQIREVATDINGRFGEDLATFLFIVFLVPAAIMVARSVEVRVLRVTSAAGLGAALAGLAIPWLAPSSGQTAMLVWMVIGAVVITAASLAPTTPGDIVGRVALTVAGALAGIALLVWIGDHADLFGTWPFIGAVVFAALFGGLSKITDPAQRLLFGGVGSAAIAALVATQLRRTIWDRELDDVARVSVDLGLSIGWVGLAIGAAVGAGLGWAIGRVQPSSMVLFAGLGTLVGGIGNADFASGGTGQTLLLLAVGGAIIGVGLGLAPRPDSVGRQRVNEGSRKFIFAGPAMFFILMGLIFPLLRTVVLSLKDKRSTEWVWFENYQEIFTNFQTFNTDKAGDFFTSRLLFFGGGLIILAIVAALIIGLSRGDGITVSGGPRTALFAGAFIIFTGAMTVLRGSVFNNLWWVVTVTVMSTILGMAVAVLADRARFESVAKSFIFLPLAISFVGAGIIWRFMFQARPPQKDQTGVLNRLWVGLGEISTGGGTGKTIILVILFAILASLLVAALAAGRNGNFGTVTWIGAGAVPVAWLTYRMLDSNLGGFVRAGTEGDIILGNPVLFLAEPPFNNVWLMAILIWIQTGFAMVIFSAALKAVPQELIEAAKVDGANDSQVFWKITLPQVTPTIGVVVTTLIVLVMKVFDIVKVTTDGDFDTQVIANAMWQSAFKDFNTGLGSALAALLFFAVLPVMYMNIRRTQKAAAL